MPRPLATRAPWLVAVALAVAMLLSGCTDPVPDGALVTVTSTAYTVAGRGPQVTYEAASGRLVVTTVDRPGAPARSDPRVLSAEHWQAIRVGAGAFLAAAPGPQCSDSPVVGVTVSIPDRSPRSGSMVLCGADTPVVARQLVAVLELAARA